jgi:hypothetical protein
MTLQGAELAIGRLHPEFAVRLEHAIRESERMADVRLHGRGTYCTPVPSVWEYSAK